MSAPARVSLVEFPHKGIRNILSQLSLLAGSTDFTDKEAVSLLKTRTAEIMAMLDEHAQIENDLIIPLLEGKVPAGAIHDREDHDAIHLKQEDLLRQLDVLLSPGITPAAAIAAGKTFYQDLSLLHAAHLNHMMEEERGSQVLIWQHYTDDELRQVQGKIMQRLDPALKLSWMRYMLPAFNPAERQLMLAIQKANAPEHFWLKLEELAREILPEMAQAS